MARPIAVTTELLGRLGKQDIDDALPYRADYRQQWLGGAASGVKPQ